MTRGIALIEMLSEVGEPRQLDSVAWQLNTKPRNTLTDFRCRNVYTRDLRLLSALSTTRCTSDLKLPTYWIVGLILMQERVLCGLI
jgi:hypothetical protein